MRWKVGSEAPSSLDWRDKGFITSIKDQGDCGSCWSFTGVAIAESVLIMNGWEENTADLSEQYLLECTYASNCSSGYMEYMMN